MRRWLENVVTRFRRPVTDDIVRDLSQEHRRHVETLTQALLEALAEAVHKIAMDYRAAEEAKRDALRIEARTRRLLGKMVEDVAEEPEDPHPGDLPEAGERPLRVPWEGAGPPTDGGSDQPRPWEPR